MRLHLVDTNPEMADRWQVHFAPFPEVQIVHGDILALAHNTIVSPANSYRFMDGGIDGQYTDCFGFRPQEEVQRKIALRPEGYLPVGAAALVGTGHSRVPYLISAPTMIGPGPVEAANSFFAMSAVLRVAAGHPEAVTDVFCPGLGTGIGEVPPDKAAREMAAAYGHWKERASR